MLERFIDGLLHTLLDLGYPGIVVLMAMESSILPVPSELVMPPAGYWAAKGQMSFPVALICGVVGSVIGALANYYGAQLIGRPLIQRYGRYVLVPEKKWHLAESWINRYSVVGIFLPQYWHRLPSRA